MNRNTRWMAGAASALAAALLAGGGIAVALQAQGAQPQAAAASAAQTADDGETLASLTSLEDLAPDLAQPAALVAPAATTAPSPSGSASASGSGSAAKHPARAALRRALAVIIRQDGSAQYGEHAQTAARAAINRFAAAFRHLPEKLRQDLWTLAGAPADQEVADAQNIKNNALNGTYGPEVQKLAQAIQKAPAKSTSPSPSPSTGS